MSERISDRVREIAVRAGTTVEEVIRFLDSPAGRRLRRILATSLIVSAPLVMRIPGLRKTPLGRVVEFVGGATLVVKLAELIRDWEPRRDLRRGDLPTT